MYKEKDEIYGYLPNVEKLNETDIPIAYFPGKHNAIKENIQKFLGILQNIIT